MGRQSERNRTINVFKGIACILVVINHYHHSGNLGNIEYTVSHLGVPFFFLVSGYYLFDSKMKLTVKRMMKKIKWISLLLAVHFSIYFVDNCIKRYLINGTEFTLLAPFQDLRRIITWQTIKSSLLWSTGIFGSAQWFLVALLQVYLVVLCLVVLHKEKLLIKNGIAVAWVLLFTHIVVRYVLYSVGVTKIGFMAITETAVVRNAWFDGLPFVLLGVYIRSHTISDTRLLHLWGGIGLAVSVVEAYFVRWQTAVNPLGCVLYFGTIVAVVCFFCYAIQNPQIDCRLMEYIGDKCSMLIYFLHPVIGWYITFWLKWVGAIENQMIQLMIPLIVISSSIFIALVLQLAIAGIKGTREKIKKFV